jgi:flagellar protein FlaG
MNSIHSNNVNANALSGDSSQRTNTDYKDKDKDKDNVKAKLATLESTQPRKSIEQAIAKTEQVNEAAQKEILSAPQLEKVAKQLQDFVGEMNRGLQFIVDEDSGRDVIKVIDKSSGDLVKQYPSEEVLSLVAKLSEATGNFIDSKI